MFATFWGGFILGFMAALAIGVICILAYASHIANVAK